MKRGSNGVTERIAARQQAPFLLKKPRGPQGKTHEYNLKPADQKKTKRMKREMFRTLPC